MKHFELEYFSKRLHLNQHGEIRIISDSMSPLIFPGEIISVTPISEKLKRFDIVLFNYYGEPFCHFFWGETSTEGMICTKSLRKPHLNDIPFHEKHLVGRIVDKKITLFQKLKVYLMILWHKM